MVGDGDAVDTAARRVEVANTFQGDQVPDLHTQLESVSKSNT